MTCKHCREDHTSTEMQALSTADPSDCCTRCWREFELSRAKSKESFGRKWAADRRDEESAGCFDPNADPEMVHRACLKLKEERTNA